MAGIRIFRIEFKPLAFKKDTRSLIGGDDSPELFVQIEGLGFRLSLRRSGEDVVIPVALIPFAALPLRLEEGEASASRPTGAWLDRHITTRVQHAFHQP